MIKTLPISQSKTATLTRLAALFSLAFCTASAGSAVAATTMKPGLWEITVQTEMPGMPVKQPPVTMRQCYKPEDVKDPQRMIPRQQDAGFKCDTRDYKMSGDTATWNLQCSGQGMSMNGKGSMTMKGESYSGSSVMEMKTAGQNMKMSQNMRGKWVGECK